ncbi:carbamoyltransferase [Pokkaliibacter plantistimulans]|uniref:Carbamoyltransferase n=1 Tax=Pokkaliibacter plantistimulans TaxID=1635171 RepID=A0ABX5LSD4_9GAMM|nr:carbamoyltransferase C-terminal domain-containing protein [Pokkaliibacter plantistimulans]PXF29576.1 carbamoyltransferase [Pokkaliibacter plantistimulans]
MNILGINYFFHDSSACVVMDGQLRVALEEERFTRRKHTNEFPVQAIERCLQISGISMQQIDHIAVSIAPTKDLGKKVAYSLGLGKKVAPFIKHEFKGIYVKQKAFWNWYKGIWGSRDGGPKVHFVEHHLSHVAGSYFVSPYQKAALLSLDGSGEWSTAMLGTADGDQLNFFGESHFPHSLGSFYEAATEFCGFQPNYDEGKTMGLAPFGNPDRFYKEVEKLVNITSEGQIQIDLSYFEYQNAGYQRCGQKFYDTFGQPRSRKGAFEDHHHDVAAAFQKVLEDKVLQMCHLLEQKTDADYLVIAGGVALNSVMNGRILRDTRFKDVYVMPAAGDNGSCIGAAYYLYNHILRQPRNFVHLDPYLGTEYSNEQIRKTLDECKLSYTRSEDICLDTAQMLRDGQIIGWFQGRMEIGPRALGSRSILADPTLPGMKDKINAEVKHREAYRPFAPSCPAEYKQDFFDIKVNAPFMLKVCDVLPEKREVIPAITHVDGSARLQTVHADTNPLYHRMISEFGKLSGVPVVLNTSFNIMGEPVVESPLHAIRCFFSTGLDVLVLGDYIVRK